MLNTLAMLVEMRGWHERCRKDPWASSAGLGPTYHSLSETLHGAVWPLGLVVMALIALFLLVLRIDGGSLLRGCLYAKNGKGDDSR